MSEKTKTCIECGEPKPLRQFGRRRKLRAEAVNVSEKRLRRKGLVLSSKLARKSARRRSARRLRLQNSGKTPARTLRTSRNGLSPGSRRRKTS
jgi:hypothetical protein